MGLWVKGLRRNSTNEHRVEDISDVLNGCDRIKHFINSFAKMKFGYYSYDICDYEICDRQIIFRIISMSLVTEICIDFSPSDFDYSLYMYLNSKLKSMNLDNDQLLFAVSRQMSENMSRYLNNMTSMTNDFSILFDF